jgi:phytol kinase
MRFILPILIYSACFLALFALVELFYWKLKMKAEHTRKLVHAGTGILALGFPIFFYSVWQVVIICTLFLVLLLLSRRSDFLRSINKVDRHTSGSILYPVIVIIVFAFYQNIGGPADQRQLVYFYLPILILAICDPVAALTGTWYKEKKKLTGGKTLFGSACFSVSAFIISTLLLLSFHMSEIAPALFYSLVIALVTSLAERVSGKGWDNFTIPLGAMAVLYLIKVL